MTDPFYDKTRRQALVDRGLMPCGHDQHYTDTADEGTSHCVYCRALAAEDEIKRLQSERDTWKDASDGYHKSLVKLSKLHDEVCQLCDKLREAEQAEAKP